MSDQEEPRKLTLEEIYQCLHRDWKASLQRIGELQSDIDELIYQRDILKKRIEEISTPKPVILRNDDKVCKMEAEISKLKAQNVRLRNDNGILISKLIKYEKQI